MSDREMQALLAECVPKIDDGLAPLVAAGMCNVEDAEFFEHQLAVQAWSVCGSPEPTVIFPRTRTAIATVRDALKLIGGS
jgi:hypothetical protein